MDDHLVVTLEHQYRLQQSWVGVEPEPKFATGRAIVQRFDPQCPFGGLFGVLPTMP